MLEERLMFLSDLIKVLKKAFMNKKDLAVVRQMFAQTVFTHKVQECACERNETKQTIFDWISIVCASLTIISLALDSILPGWYYLKHIGIVLTLFELIVLIIEKNFQYGKRANEHKNSAKKFLQLRNDYLNLIADIMSNKEGVDIRRNELTNRYSELCDLSPQTEDSDYTRAQIKLGTKGKKGEEHYIWREEEIDMFLPKELKSNKQNTP